MQWQLTPALGAHVAHSVPPEIMWINKLLRWPPLAPHVQASQQWSLASLAGPDFFPDSLGCGASHPSPFRLSPCSQIQSSPQDLTFKVKALILSPNSP